MGFLALPPLLAAYDGNNAWFRYRKAEARNQPHQPGVAFAVAQAVRHPKLLRVLKFSKPRIKQLEFSPFCKKVQGSAEVYKNLWGLFVPASCGVSVGRHDSCSWTFRIGRNGYKNLQSSAEKFTDRLKPAKTFGVCLCQQAAGQRLVAMTRAHGLSGLAGTAAEIFKVLQESSK